MKFEILAGDFDKNCKLKIASSGAMHLEKSNGFLNTEKIPLHGRIANVMQVTEENKSSLLAKAGWGTAGAVVGGIVAAPLALAGLLAGVIAKGNKKEVCIAITLKSGQRILANTDQDTYKKFLMDSF